MTIAIVALSLLALALLAALIIRERAHDDERQKLLDRIQAPAAAQIAAVERAVAEREPVQMPDLYSEPVPQSDDLRLEALMEGS